MNETDKLESSDTTTIVYWLSYKRQCIDYIKKWSQWRHDYNSEKKVWTWENMKTQLNQWTDKVIKEKSMDLIKSEDTISAVNW
jgi:hypothetical protein